LLTQTGSEVSEGRKQKKEGNPTGRSKSIRSDFDTKKKRASGGKTEKGKFKTTEPLKIKGGLAAGEREEALGDLGHGKTDEDQDYLHRDTAR